MKPTLYQNTEILYNDFHKLPQNIERFFYLLFYYNFYNKYRICPENGIRTFLEGI